MCAAPSRVSSPSYPPATLDYKNLRPYQIRMIEFIKSNPRCAVWADMGLGKTVGTLTALSEMLADFEGFRPLVVAPAKVARDTWPEEVQHWRHLQHLTCKFVGGTPKQRARILEAAKPGEILTISWDNLKWLVDHYQGTLRNRREWPFDTLVLDEASMFKNPRTKRFKSLVRTMPGVSRVIELTGTPTSTGLLNIWTQVYLLDAGERLGKTYNTYQWRYFIPLDPNGYRWKLRQGSEAEIQLKVAPLVFRLDAQDHLSLPGRINNTVEIDLPAGLAEQYTELEEQFLIDWNGAEIAAVNAATLTSKLRQFANGFLYDENRDAHFVHKEKLTALERILDEHPGENILVGYDFVEDRERILTHFKGDAVFYDDSDDIKARWNAGEIRILVGHPASMGHGLNLQAGGHIAVWYSIPWSLELYQQFNERIGEVRQAQVGSDKPFICHHILVRGTIDETLARVQKERLRTQKELLEAVKRDIDRRVK